MPNTINCAGCLTTIVEKEEYLTCSGCRKAYDLKCANVSAEKFRDTLVGDRRADWKCVMCVSKQPKTDNSNTPVRGHHDDGINLRRGAAAAPSPSEYGANETMLNATLDASVTDSQLLALEMRYFREELKATRIQIEKLNANLDSLTLRMDKCDKKIDDLQEKVDNIERCVNVGHNSDNGQLINVIERLKCDLNDRDQELLNNDVEISNICELKSENAVHLAISVAKKLGVDLNEQDIVSVTRVGKPQNTSTAAGAASPSGAARPRPLVLRLTRRAPRDQLLKAARVRRGATTEDIGLPVPHTRFYVNERLTFHNRQLFRQCRELMRKYNWRYAWTREGRIYMRKRDTVDSPRHRIRTEGDLARIFGSDDVGAVKNK